MNERTVTIVTLVGLAVILMALGGAVWYLMGEISVKETQIGQLQEQIGVARTRQGAIPDLKKKIREIEDKFKDAEDRIPRLDDLQYDDMVILLDKLRKLASVYVENASYSLGNRGVGPTGQPIPASINKAEYQITVRGGWFNILRFINLLESQSRFISVQDFQINPGGSEGPGKLPTRNLNVKIMTFAQDVGAANQAPEGVQPVIPEPEKASQSTPLPN